jgi:hypothetical protein
LPAWTGGRPSDWSWSWSAPRATIKTGAPATGSAPGQQDEPGPSADQDDCRSVHRHNLRSPACGKPVISNQASCSSTH